jgi:glycosyltransferase involved in cell wall biosynthesis
VTLLVHDFAYEFGGAERVTAALADILPEARVLAIGGKRPVFERMGVADRFETILPTGKFEDSYRSLTPLFPRLVRRTVDELVVSSSYAFAHHVRSTVRHVEYCHSPIRQLWIAEESYKAALGARFALALRLFGSRLRRADLVAVRAVDTMVASCENVRTRVNRIYGRDAVVVHPPVSLDTFYPDAGEREPDLVLLVARLVEPYKQVRSVLDTVAKLPVRLAVIGHGRDAATLQAAAPANVTFVGRVGDQELRRWYSRSGVVVFPSEDDFGIVPVEAMACGTPVVALDAGGARETVIHDVTGLRYPEPKALAGALKDALARAWDRNRIREHASSFGLPAFSARMRKIVAQD